MAGIDFTTKSLTQGFITNTGGLNSTASALNVQDNQATDIQNIDFDRFGAFKQRNGSTQLNTSAANSGATCTSIHFFENKTADILLGTFGDKIFKMDSLDGTWDDITVATITAGNNNLFQWITFNNVAYGTNNVDAPQKVDATPTHATFTVPTGLTAARWIETFENYAFLANSTISGTARPTRLNWSALDDAETWDAADFVEIGLDDGQAITGLKTLGERLVIFKERSIYIGIFTGDADIPFVFKKTPSDVGAISGYSIQEVLNGLVFLAKDGFYFFDGQNSTKLSDRINTTVRSLEKSRFEFATSGYQTERNRYWCSFTTEGGGTNNRIITWDAFNNAFSIYVGLASNSFEVLVTGGEERIYFGDYSGFAYRVDDSSTVNDIPSGTSTAIDSFYKTRWYNFGDIVNVKGIQELVLYFELETSATELTLGYSYDLEDNDQYTQTIDISDIGDLWDTGVWDEASWAKAGAAIFRVDLAGRGRVVRLNFSNCKLDQKFQINGIGFMPHLETHV